MKQHSNPDQKTKKVFPSGARVSTSSFYSFTYYSALRFDTFASIREPTKPTLFDLFYNNIMFACVGSEGQYPKPPPPVSRRCFPMLVQGKKCRSVADARYECFGVYYEEDGAICRSRGRILLCNLGIACMHPFARCRINNINMPFKKCPCMQVLFKPLS